MAARDTIIYLVIGAYRLVTHLFWHELRKMDVFPSLLVPNVMVLLLSTRRETLK